MSDLTIRKKYRVNLSKEQLFEAWISPDTIIPPVSKIEVDAKIGGFLKIIVKTPKGSSVMVGKFIEFSYPTQLLYTWEWDNDGEITQIKVDFHGLTDSTEIDIVHSGFHNAESCARHDAGWDAYVDGVLQMLQNT